VQLDGSARNFTGVSRLGALSIVFFVFGIARSWQLVGARDLSLASTLAAVIHRAASESTSPQRHDQAAESEPGANHDDP
jgi:hypothetical protein